MDHPANQFVNIVVVEDDTLIRENLCEFLELEGFHVTSAKNGKEGLAAIESFKGNCLVLLDMQMPVMTGDQMLTEVLTHEIDAIRNVKVIVLTARHEPVRHAVTSFMRKPYGLIELLDEIHRINASSL